MKFFGMPGKGNRQATSVPVEEAWILSAVFPDGEKR
jgi:hypothetical protein